MGETSVVVLGAGRSGTSLVAGLLAGAGFDPGRDLVAARPANPKGFFEDRRVNELNEQLLAAAAPTGWRARGLVRAGRRAPGPWARLSELVGGRLDPFPGPGRRWLADVDPAWTPEVSASTRTAMGDLLSDLEQPFVLKDPWFCHTLAAWRPLFDPGVRYVCVFRRPGRTIDSMQRELDAAPYLSGTVASRAGLERAWRSSYRHVFDQHSVDGRWLFLHLDQVLDPVSRHALAEFVGRDLPDDFADAALQRSTAGASTTEATEEVYAELCRRAGYEAHGSRIEA